MDGPQTLATGAKTLRRLFTLVLPSETESVVLLLASAAPMHVPLDSGFDILGSGGDRLRYRWPPSSGTGTELARGSVTDEPMHLLLAVFMSRVMCAMLKFVEGDLFLPLGLLPLEMSVGLGFLLAL